VVTFYNLQSVHIVFQQVYFSVILVYSVVDRRLFFVSYSI